MMYFYQEQATISYSHKVVMTISRPITQIPFLNPSESKDENQNINAKPETKTPVFRIQARTRQVIAIDVINNDCKKGYLSLLNAGVGIMIGNAAVSNENDKCHIVAYNVG